MTACSTHAKRKNVNGPEEIYQTHTLGNGLKLIHQRTPSKAAYCGLIINTGSRDEEECEAGVAHFIEHLIFKGTGKRKAFHILSRMEDVGGELNAYTTKEDTCLYASFLPKDYERALELFSDVIFHSVFPEKEIEKEKEVVIDEINSYKDTPGEWIFDDFEEMVFRGESIGRNILGREEGIRNLTRERLLGFVRRNYKPQRMVISSVGDIPFERFVRLAERYFGSVPGDDTLTERIKPGGYAPQYAEVQKGTFQTHCVIGTVAYSYREEKRLPLSMLVDILGGSGMNSRLNLNIREKHGLAYNVEAAYTPYSDTGLFSVYFGCDAADLDKCLRLCKRELEALYREPLGLMQLQKARMQAIGRLTLSADNYENTMLANGKSFLVYGKVEGMRSLCERIVGIRTEQLQEVAKEIFDIDRQSVLIYK